MDIDLLIARWKANTAAAGIRLTDADIERIREAGFLERAVTAEAVMQRVTQHDQTPRLPGPAGEWHVGGTP